MRLAENQETIRKKQQGEGRGIVSVKHGDYQIVATGNTLHFSKNWRTFTDFLLDHIKNVLGHDWGNAEIQKDPEDRHVIIRWYQELCLYQEQQKRDADGLYESEMNGVVYCYVGLAYNLYLIRHNVELQDRLVARLKDQRQFQGAYYELIVANTLIRAGFELELEDEQDETQKHCEFSARSKITGEKYWVEAKMRSVSGLMGKTKVDSAKGENPLSQLTKHLNQALAKPAPDRRMIFIDVNAEPQGDSTEPDWAGKATRRLDAKEKALRPHDEAYLFVTNFAFHRALDETRIKGAALAYGLGIPDFGKAGTVLLPDWYRSKQKHIDAHNVMEALRSYPQIPDTFDGTPSSEAFGRQVSGRLLKGETYFFKDVEESGLLGTVTSVAVFESEKKAMVSVSAVGGRPVILEAKLSDSEVADYIRYGPEYFGEDPRSGRKLSDVFELYEHLVEIHLDTPRGRLLAQAKDRPGLHRLESLDHEDLVLEFCAGLAITIEAHAKRDK